MYPISEAPSLTLNFILDYLPLDFLVKHFLTEFMFLPFPQLPYFIVWSHVTGFPHFALDNLCLTVLQVSKCFL